MKFLLKIFLMWAAALMSVLIHIDSLLRPANMCLYATETEREKYTETGCVCVCKSERERGTQRAKETGCVCL